MWQLKPSISGNNMAVSDVRSAADAVRAFLEHLIDPMLPAKLIDPSPSQQKKVAQQVPSFISFIHHKPQFCP